MNRQSAQAARPDQEIHNEINGCEDKSNKAED